MRQSVDRAAGSVSRVNSRVGLSLAGLNAREADRLTHTEFKNLPKSSVRRPF
jgi:hypothetical protein